MANHNPTPTKQLTALRERICVRFNLEELRLLVFDLDVKYDELRGETLKIKTQALLEHLEKQGRIPALLVKLKQRRPDEDWHNILPTEPEAKFPVQLSDTNSQIALWKKLLPILY